MRIVDKREERDISHDIQRIKRLEKISVVSYYRQYVTRDVVLLVILIPLLFISLRVVASKVELVRSGMLLSLCFFLLIVIGGAGGVLCDELERLNFRPYLWRKLQFEMLQRSLIRCSDYYQMDSVFKQYSDDIMFFGTRISSRFLNRLKVYCMQESFAVQFGGLDVDAVDVKRQAIYLKVGEEKIVRTTLHVIDKKEAEENALVLTNSGAVLYEAV